MNIRHLAVSASLIALGFTGPALADHDSDSDSDSDSYYGRSAISVGGYAGNPSRARYDYAKVLSAEPIVRWVDVRRPVRECWQDIEYYSVERPASGTGASTLVGAIVGGVVGHQFGSGRGNDAATVAGTLIGAAIGNDAGRRNHGYVSHEYSRPIERCSTHISQRREQRIDGYRVTYRYKGQTYATRMPYDPGRKIRVRVDIRPVG